MTVSPPPNGGRSRIGATVANVVIWATGLGVLLGLIPAVLSGSLLGFGLILPFVGGEAGLFSALVAVVVVALLRRLVNCDRWPVDLLVALVSAVVAVVGIYLLLFLRFSSSWNVPLVAGSWIAALGTIVFVSLRAPWPVRAK